MWKRVGRKRLAWVIIEKKYNNQGWICFHKDREVEDYIANVKKKDLKSSVKHVLLQ